jgi:hypothetical protein
MKADAQPKSSKRWRFVLVPFEQIKFSGRRDYCIKGLLPRTGIAVVWGPPKCGKSFTVFDATLHIALGWTYRGRKVVQGSVVYCAFEGQDAYGKRKEAFLQQYAEHLPDKVPFSLMPIRMDLIKDHKQFIAEVKAQAGDQVPAVVALDTLNRSLAGSESSDEDMSKYVQAADALREAFGCLVIIIHHCGIEGTRPRGHTSLTGAADAQLAVKRQGDIVTVTVEWMKDGAEGDIVVSRLKRVIVGQDEDGDDVWTCIVEPVDPAEVAANKPTRKLSDRQRLALDALGECVLAAGQPAPTSFGLPAGIRVAKAEAWRDELLARAVLDSDGKNPRQDWKRLRQELAARRLIGDRDGMVWRAT